MVFLHLYLKYTQPLFVQAIMAFKALYEAKTVKIHVLGQNAEGDLKRPFKSGPGMFGGMSHHADSADHLFTQPTQPPRTPRQIRLPLKRPKNVLALRKSDIEYFLPGPQSEIYIAVPILTCMPGVHIPYCLGLFKYSTLSISGRSVRL